jgi:hypothetical protein
MRTELAGLQVGTPARIITASGASADDKRKMDTPSGAGVDGKRKMETPDRKVRMRLWWFACGYVADHVLLVCVRLCS